MELVVCLQIYQWLLFDNLFLHLKYNDYFDNLILHLKYNDYFDNLFLHLKYNDCKVLQCWRMNFYNRKAWYGWMGNTIAMPLNFPSLGLLVRPPFSSEFTYLDKALFTSQFTILHRSLLRSWIYPLLQGWGIAIRPF